METEANIVAVFGSSQIERGHPAYEQAQVVGALLATEGLTVCTGGYGGVMEAVSRGAKAAGGSTIGVTTSWFEGLTPNAWVDKEIHTATFMERLSTITGIGHGYLALLGGIGTLTEIGTVWSLLQTSSLPRRPFVLLSEPWAELLRFCRDALVIRAQDLQYLQLADTPAEAVATLALALKGPVEPQK